MSSRNTKICGEKSLSATGHNFINVPFLPFRRTNWGQLAAGNPMSMYGCGNLRKERSLECSACPQMRECEKSIFAKVVRGKEKIPPLCQSDAARVIVLFLNVDDVP